MALICPFWTSRVKTTEVCADVAAAAGSWLSSTTTEDTFPGLSQYIDIGSSAWNLPYGWGGPGPFMVGQKEAWATIGTLVGEGSSIPYFSIDAGPGASITSWMIVGGEADGNGGYRSGAPTHPGLGVSVKQWSTAGNSTLFSFGAYSSVPGEGGVWRTRTFQIQPTVGAGPENTLTLHVKHILLFV